MQITIKVPDKNTPGFARRMYRAAKFAESMKAGINPQLVEEMVDFLSEYIEGDREQAKKYIWDCTESQFNEMIGAVSGGSAEQVPPPSAETSVMP